MSLNELDLLKRSLERMNDEDKALLEGRIADRWFDLMRLKRSQLAAVVEIRLKGPTVPGRAGRLALVQLRRMGDLLSIAPLAQRYQAEGWDVTWFGEPEHTRILEGTGLATIEMWSRLEAPPGQFDRVLITQVDQNPVRVDKGGNFVLQQWARGGRPEGLGQWPLTFSRKWSRELTLPGRCILWNGTGHSSKWDQAGRFGSWLRMTFGDRVVNLPTDLAHPTQLLDWLTACNRAGGVLVSVDSLPIHLAYATLTPTIVLSRGQTPNQPPGWEASEPMPHWLGHFSYEDVFKNTSLSTFRKTVDESSLPIHVVDWWLPTDIKSDEYARITKARKTWKDSGLAVLPWSGLGRRSSSDLGDKKSLPYIKDFFDWAVNYTSPDAWIVFTNADVRLCRDAHSILDRSGTAGCAFSRRKDMDMAKADSRHWETTDPGFGSIPDHVGADLFAVTGKWWAAHRDEVPDLLMSYEGWDYCMRHLMWKYNPAAQLPTCCYHVYHPSYWARSDVIQDSPGQIWNRRVGREWATRMGLPVSTSGHYLFDPDPAGVP